MLIEPTSCLGAGENPTFRLSLWNASIVHKPAIASVRWRPNHDVRPIGAKRPGQSEAAVRVSGWVRTSGHAPVWIALGDKPNAAAGRKQAIARPPTLMALRPRTRMWVFQRTDSLGTTSAWGQDQKSLSLLLFQRRGSDRRGDGGIRTLTWIKPQIQTAGSKRHRLCDLHAGPLGAGRELESRRVSFQGI